MDQTIGKALACGSESEDELRSMLLKELKIYNYVPQSSERDYLDCVWGEFLKERSRREAKAVKR